MTYQNILYDVDDRILTVTINRPTVMNALDPNTHAELADAFDRYEKDSGLWVAIITGAGEQAFCAGGDISVMAKAKSHDDYKVPETGYGGLTNRHSCDKPIIAAVNGFAMGGGFEIVMACDLAIATAQAKFGLPEPKIGTAAVAGGMHRLVRDIGLKPAMELLLTARTISAEKALQLGLVNQVVTVTELLPAAMQLAHDVLKCAPLAVQATKHCALQGRHFASTEQAQQAQHAGEFAIVEKMMKSADVQEGMQAFLEKRKPQWRGE